MIRSRSRSRDGPDLERKRRERREKWQKALAATTGANGASAMAGACAGSAVAAAAPNIAAERAPEWPPAAAPERQPLPEAPEAEESAETPTVCGEELVGIDEVDLLELPPTPPEAQPGGGTLANTRPKFPAAAPATAAPVVSKAPAAQGAALSSVAPLQAKAPPAASQGAQPYQQAPLQAKAPAAAQSPPAGGSAMPPGIAPLQAKGTPTERPLGSNPGAVGKAAALRAVPGVAANGAYVHSGQAGPATAPAAFVPQGGYQAGMQGVQLAGMMAQCNPYVFGQLPGQVQQAFVPQAMAAGGGPMANFAALAAAQFAQLQTNAYLQQGPTTAQMPQAAACWAMQGAPMGVPELGAQAGLPGASPAWF